MGTTLSFRLGVIMLAGFVLLQLMLVIALQWPGGASDRGDYGLPAPAAMAQIIDAMERAGPQGADLLASSYDGSLFTVRIQPQAPRDFREVPPSMGDLARRYRVALADHNVVVDGGPGRLNRLLGDRARPLRFLIPIRVTVWLRDGRVMVLTGRPSSGLRAYLLRRSTLGLVGGGLLLAVLWLALRQTTGPLRRLTRDVQALGQDLRALDAPVEGSRETRALASAFNDMKGRIAGLVEERTFILAGIAHDMRTYLTRLRLRAEFIGDAGQRARAGQDLDQMSALLDDNLLFAGIDRAGMAQLRAIDLAALTRDLADARIDLDRIRLSPGPPAMVMADAAGLERIFGNLVDNALRHAAHVDIGIRAAGDGVVWHFADDGPGVPADRIARLGRAYDRLDPSRDRRTGGAGLGLAIVRALAEAMGGTVAFGRSDAGGLSVEIALAPASGAAGI
ncbi:ATP-binding protein [Sphingobium aquiterrae]|uniref:ATP-binding protein n=1 Tax=Sphingobium aquiterrae TaxID=2038656 RepID=UPI003018BA4E